MFDFSLERQFCDLDSRTVVDFIGDRFEAMAHRVVRDRRKVDNGIDPFEKSFGKLANVTEDLAVEDCFGKGGDGCQTVSEISEVIPYKVGFRKNRPQVAH